MMRAMILAAGRGERMRPLTDDCPKPLLEVGGMPLIEHHIRKLADIGIKDIVINHAWLGEKIEQYLGDGSRWQVSISYSDEQEQALETAGGIIKALPLLGDEPFLVVNGDIYTDFNFAQLPTLEPGMLAHLYLVENPEHNPKGDFFIDNDLLANTRKFERQQSYTFSGIALYRPEFFHNRGQKPSVLPLAPLLRDFAEQQRISASVLDDPWMDIGTPQRLAQVNLGLLNTNNRGC